MGLENATTGVIVMTRLLHHRYPQTLKQIAKYAAKVSNGRVREGMVKSVLKRRVEEGRVKEEGGKYSITDKALRGESRSMLRRTITEGHLRVTAPLAEARDMDGNVLKKGQIVGLKYGSELEGEIVRIRGNQLTIKALDDEGFEAGYARGDMHVDMMARDVWLEESAELSEGKTAKKLDGAEYGDTVTLKIKGKPFSFNRVASGFYVYRGAFKWTKDIEGEPLNPRPLKAGAAVSLARKHVSESVEEAEISEAPQNVLSDFLAGGEQMFLQAVAKEIKKVARGYAEKVDVKRSGSTVWLEYKGQDHSDMDFEWVAHVTVVGHPKATLHIQATPIHGRTSRTVKSMVGALSVQNVVDQFQQDFG
jgi:hypothetical protein